MKNKIPDNALFFSNICNGCKHGKVDQKNAPTYHDFWVKGLKVVAKCCLVWILPIFYDDLYCYDKCLNVEYQVQIFKAYHYK
jgi:hypothetical protein